MKKTEITIAIILAFSALTNCDKIREKLGQQKTEISATAPQKGEKVVANFDVDIKATEELKNTLAASLAANAPTDAVETFLKAQGYECRPDPTNNSERGCDKVEAKEGCMVMGVVHTLPYQPTGAQIIKACGLN